jgi:hypothetical protein
LYRTNLAIIVVMMQVSKKVPFDDPDVLLIVRGVYILSNVIILGLYLYTQAQISKKNGSFESVSRLNVSSWVFASG